ncbi:hypothetical protein, partial [Pseudoalteromonas distincta]|uniref:hypothetical protein n=1 Tax=Pseudoalteromonas distincta TaxID=77608 RepID=UPI0034E84A00
MDHGDVLSRPFVSEQLKRAWYCPKAGGGIVKVPVKAAPSEALKNGVALPATATAATQSLSV